MHIASRLAALIVPFVCIQMSSAASFDCDKAITLTERTICANTELSTLDDQMVQSYKNALAHGSDRSVLTVSQRTWLRHKRNTCQGDSVCLHQAYTARLAELESLPSSLGTSQAPAKRHRNVLGPSEAKCEDGRSFEIVFLIDPRTPAVYPGGPVIPSQAQLRWLGSKHVELLTDMHGTHASYANKRIWYSVSQDNIYISETNNGKMTATLCHPTK